MTTLDVVNKQIDQLLRDGKLNTNEHLTLEVERARLWRIQNTPNTPTLQTSAPLDFEDLAHWHQRAAKLLGQTVSIIK